MEPNDERRGAIITRCRGVERFDEDVRYLLRFFGRQRGGNEALVDRAPLVHVLETRRLMGQRLAEGDRKGAGGHFLGRVLGAPEGPLEQCSLESSDEVLPRIALDFDRAW
ncbi:hypothetical protein MXAN_4490 [Myxococcus xanthus DK 1622]|uniref:Uncharacterized protein n=1 Tax=Myxococcus xanthus (strain DK1622) TaxID=246197 RepID=Q1D3W4_MYXXD|nr:hypothetical protein MXAN_4490 [Myxococcus xanthus DK 1622]